MTAHNAKIKLESGEWIVVCDGRKAIILENAGDDVFPSLKTKEVFEHSDLPTRAQGADAPGRAYASIGRRRSSVSQTDWHDDAERSFLASLAKRLHTAVTTGETTKLNIVASPRALGMIRQSYSCAVRSVLNSEQGRDLVKLPVHEIERQLLS